MTNKGGRPKKEIDYNIVEKLAHIQCTQAEIAEILEISTRTLQKDKEFLRLYKKGIESGKSSLRRLQWKGAEAGNNSMLIWLGKQYLSQRDQPKEEENNEALDKLVKAIESGLQSKANTGSE